MIYVFKTFVCGNDYLFVNAHMHFNGGNKKSIRTGSVL